MPVNVRTIRGVELAKVGTWETLSHPDGWTLTPDDLRSAVEAHNAGIARPVVLKIGHEDPRFDGQPALGRVENLRIIENTTLVGDFVDVPAPIAVLLPRAFPARSTEGLINYRDQSGRGRGCSPRSRHWEAPRRE